MDERVERTVDSFFEDDDVVTPRGDIDTTRSAGSAVSSVSSSASSRSQSSSNHSSASSYAGSSPVVSPRDDPSDDSSSPPTTARSSVSSETPTEQNQAEKALPLDTERTNGTYESNDFEPETEIEPGLEKVKDLEKVKEVEEEEKVESVPRVKEIGAGDANILTVNIPSGKTEQDHDSDQESDFTDVSPMITPRPAVPVIHEEKAVEQATVSHSVTAVKVTAARPKSAHPNKGRTRKASNSSVASKNSVNSSLDFSHDIKHQNQMEKHRERLLYNTSKSSKDLNQLLEAVLVLDQKGQKRERTQTANPFPSHAVGGSSKKQNFKDIERQKEIQKENDRLLKELTTQRRRPVSAVSVTSQRSRISNASTRSAFSTASAFELRRMNSCKYSPVARNYHSKINREKESKRIDQENLALLRRLQSVKPSVQIQVSRQAVSTTPIRKTRPKNMRPKIVNTWTDGW